MTALPLRGEVWWSEHPEIGRRPAVVLSREEAIHRRRWAIVAPCTTNIRGLPSEVLLEPGDDPVSQRCAVALDSVENMPIAFLVERMGRLTTERMRQICAALEVAVDCER